MHCLLLWTHTCIWHTMVACRWITSVSAGYSSRKIRRSGKKMADAIPWRGIDHIDGTVFLPALQNDTDSRTNTVWISRSTIPGNTRTLYSLSCPLQAAEISSTQPSLSGLWKNLPVWPACPPGLPEPLSLAVLKYCTFHKNPHYLTQYICQYKNICIPFTHQSCTST